jgi:hypothetical protein
LNETDRIARGFNRYHCYSTGFYEEFDDLFARDAAIGAASAVIAYGSPSWVMLPGCTGFPWPPNPNYQAGCLPWNNLPDWEDFITSMASRWNAPWGSGKARLSAVVVWNEVRKQTV